MNFTYLLLFEIFIIFHTLSRGSNHVSNDPTFDTESTRVQTSVIGPLLAKSNPIVWSSSQEWAGIKIIII